MGPQNEFYLIPVILNRTMVHLHNSPYIPTTGIAREHCTLPPSFSTYILSTYRDMFNLPNKKGFEAVMHFLFNKLDPAKCKEEFRWVINFFCFHTILPSLEAHLSCAVYRNCWPVTDKKDEAQFRKVCNNWLSQIAEVSVFGVVLVERTFSLIQNLDALILALLG